MRGAAGRGFLLAKMYGTIARSYLGANFRDLLRLKSLADLQALLWPSGDAEAHAALPAAEIEGHIGRDALAAMRSVLEYLEEPDAILVHLFRKAEYQNLKVVLRGMAEGRVETSRLQDLGGYAGLPLDGVTDFEKAIKASPYSWTLAARKAASRARLENMIDRDYYIELSKLAKALPAPGRTGILRYVRLEISVTNAVWALRLRFSFGMDEVSARPLFVPGLGGTARRAVARSFEIPPDALDEWRRWPFGWLLADQFGEAFRSPDPIRAEAVASQRLYVRAHQLLHQYPLTLCPVVAYFVLKQREAALLKTAVEMLALGMPEKELLALVGER